MVGKRKSVAHYLQKRIFGRRTRTRKEASNIELEVSESDSPGIGETSSAEHIYPTEKSELNGSTEKIQTDYGTIQIETSPAEESQETSEDESSHSMEYLKPEVENFGRRGSFFKDGSKKIDFILVYEEESMRPAKRKKIIEWRRRFMSNLALAGLDVEEEVTVGEKTIHYIKLSAPWYVLVTYAEQLCLRAPLEIHPHPMSNWTETILKMLRISNIMHQDVPNRPVSYYTCAFKESRMEKYLGIEKKDEFFTSVQRSRIVYEILQNAIFGKRQRAEVGIERLIEEDAYTAAFPLHDGPYQMPEEEVSPENLNRRQILYEYWARWGRWYKYQPVNHIREYFGEKIAIYFAWLGFYTAWLLPASIVGFLVFMYGAIAVWFDIPTKEICNSGNTYKMCPLCAEGEHGCDYWYLSDTCIFAKVGYLFDQPASVFYSVFISFWAVAFLEYWKRKSVSLAHHWDCMGFEEEEEQPRPEFAAKATTISRNAITGAMEPTFPKRIRYQRVIGGAAVLMFMIAVVLIFVVAVIIYRLLVSVPLFQYKAFRGIAPFIASFSGAVINLLFIMLLGRMYEKIAIKLTDWEMHRTQTEYENHFTFKVFVFQFVNFYSSIFYIAFFKGRFVGYPGHYNKLFGIRGETCGNSGCFIELALQLAVIMIGKQMINNAQEIIIPKLKTWWHLKRSKLRKSSTGVKESRWSADYRMIDNEGLFQEYLEMVLQFGFITIFVVAFPLAPLFALLNNWIEIRLDAQKFVCQTRRSVAERAENIGIWFTILEFLAHLAVISNAFLIAFTSQFLPKIIYSYNHKSSLEGFINFTLAWAPNGAMSQPCRYTDFRDQQGKFTLFYWQLLGIRLAFVIIFEHIVFGVCKLIDILVPDIPESLDIKIKRNIYLAKQALGVSGVLTAARQSEDELEEEEKHTLEDPS
uniref:Anoctamin n=1 Tax=Hadrurus spadix TaxID=141984 RepID=A0A1W7RAZ4_9SCOR